MRLKRVVPLLLIIASAGAGTAIANFAAVDGFAGQHGVTCIACHNLPHPTSDDATAVLEGLPDAWDPGEVYPLTIRVEGGPDPAPAVQPQGGFEIATRNATLRIPAGSEASLRQADEVTVTYRPDGTLMRTWQVEWIAPGLLTYPAESTVWLAVVAANGNHVIATNTSDGGERFDSVDSLVRTVPPSNRALDEWRALPLREPFYTVVPDKAGWLVTGQGKDSIADTVAWSVDRGEWESRPAGTSWQIAFPALGAGEHEIAIKSIGQGRESPAVTTAFGASSTVFGRESPGIALPFILLSLSLAIWSRRP